MSFNKSYIDQMKVMGALPYDTRLEQENAQLKARVHELDGELERHAWPYSLAMAEAKINQLNEEVAQLEAELAQAKRSYDAVAAHHEVKRQYRDLIEAHRRELAGWEAAHVALDRDLAQATQREARLRESLRMLVDKNETSFGGLAYWADCWDDAKLALEETGT